MAVFLPNMIGDGKEFRILGKNYGVLCLLRLFFFFFEGNKPSKYIFFSHSVFLSILYHMAHGPCGYFAERIQTDIRVGREKELSITNFSFHTCLF